MIISRYFIGFVFFSFLGWIWECLYCMFNSGKWDNRGFLFGPYCPIYGSSVMLVYFVFCEGVMPVNSNSSVVSVFFICMIGSAIIEFLTSYVLEKIYHARWWDYSNLPFNIQGRIALPISVAFGLAGVIIVKLVLPHLSGIRTEPSLLVEFIALVLMAIMSIDLGMTLSTLSRAIDKLTQVEEQFGDRVQWAYDRVGEETEELREQLDSYASYIKMIVNDMASTLNRNEISVFHKMRYSRRDEQNIAKILENLGKGIKRK